MLENPHISTEAQRQQNHRLTVLTIGKAVVYGMYGLNFLLFANRTTIVSYGGVLAQPTVWGIAFIIVAFLLLSILVRPDLEWLYQQSQMAFVGVTSAWLIVRIIIVFQTGKDLTSPFLWAFFLLLAGIRVSIGRAGGNQFDTKKMEGLDDATVRWRKWLASRKKSEVS